MRVCWLPNAVCVGDEMIMAGLASLIKRHQKVLISVQIVLGGAIRDEGIAVESDECTISIKESFYIGR